MTVAGRSTIRILVLAASLRAESLNAHLAVLAAEAVEHNGGVAELTSIGQFDVPAYDGDLEAAEGIPPGADRFRERFELADAFATTASVSERPVHQCLSTPA